MEILEDYDLNSQAHTGHTMKNVSEALKDFIDNQESLLYTRIRARLNFLVKATSEISTFLDSIHISETVFCAEEIKILSTYKKEILALKSLIGE